MSAIYLHQNPTAAHKQILQTWGSAEGGDTYGDTHPVGVVSDAFLRVSLIWGSWPQELRAVWRPGYVNYSGGPDTLPKGSRALNREYLAQTILMFFV